MEKYFDKVMLNGEYYMCRDSRFDGNITLNGRNRVYVSKTDPSAQFSSLSAALTWAKSVCSKTNRVLLVLAPGIYTDEIVLNPNPGIDIIGSGSQNTIIHTESTYPNAPIYTIGDGYFENLCFESAGTNSYAFHLEAQGQSNFSGRTIFVNCKFDSANNHGIGCGLGDQTAIEFHGCRFISRASHTAPVYVHNFPSAANNQFAEFYSCRMDNYSNDNSNIAVIIDDATKTTGSGATSPAYFTFSGCSSQAHGVQVRLSQAGTKNDCMSYLKINGKSPSNIVNTNLTLLPSAGNTFEGLNSLAADNTKCGVTATVSAYGQCFITPRIDPTYCDISVEVYNQSGQQITPTKIETANSSIAVYVDGSYIGTGISVTYYMTPKAYY